MSRLITLVLLFFVFLPPGLAAQTTPQAFQGPPPPALPASIARDGDGRATVRAARLEAPLRVDGQLDEPIYTTVQPMSGFVQNEPVSGQAATERTDVWVLFDDTNVYVTVRAFESRPDLMVVNEMRRDSNTLVQNENFGFIFDTYYDRRNGVLFNFNPAGGRMDGQVTNEGNYNGDWNPVWNLAVGRFEGGWTAEAAIPFKSLRYGGEGAQLWGFNARRINRWKNEVSFLTEVAAGSGNAGLFRVSDGAALVGIEAPPLRSLDVKPFVISDITTDLSATPGVRNDLGGDFGLDVKYGLTPSLTADLTWRTDFAQVEADEQQVNLTRFSLFFPEKREFFLENQGLFNFGNAGQGRGNVPILFYSRRIGLDGGQQVPLAGGGRVSGRLGPFGVGLLSVQTEDTDVAPGTNFSVVRLQRDILRRSSVGAMVTRRSISTRGPGSNEAYGLDGRFAFFQNLTINAMWATTRTDGLPQRDDDSYRVQVNYDGDRYGAILHRVVVQEHFNPESGFIFRSDFHKYFAQGRFSPRPARIRAVRKFTFQGEIDHISHTSGRLETRELTGLFGIEFQNSDTLQVTYTDWYEGIVEPFTIAPGVTIPTGGYNFGNLRTDFTFGQQRPVSGTVFVEQGAFWDGDKTTVGFSGGRARVTSQLAVEPGVSLNKVTLPHGDFTTTLVTSRLTYTVTPLMFVSGLVQYNSNANAVSANVRLRWEYQPGSELFIVYNESRDTLARGVPDIQNRAFIIKVNRLFRL